MAMQFMRESLSLLISICSISISFAQSSEKSININQSSSKVSGSVDRPYIEKPKELSEPSAELSPNVVSQTKMEAVEIPKNQVYKLGDAGPTTNTDADTFAQKPNKRYINRWFRDISGFRIFIDKGVTLGTGRNANTRFDFMVSAGYQFNPIFYLGGGQGYSLSLNKKKSSSPTFGNLRLNFYDEYTTPFLDIKAGYSMISGTGLYLNPNLGWSFSKEKSKKALNVSIGYTFQRARDSDKGVDDRYHGISLRAGYEF